MKELIQAPTILHRLSLLENRILRRIFRPKRDEVTGGWRKIHDEELYQYH
jgi:hypothetical protein